jgi:photosystem II stability/assembly factor-like uncharacterized protein
MANTHRLYVGTIGEGLWRSVDAGETFVRACDGMFVECHVRALAVHPRHDRVLYLGSELGLFRSDDGAANWTQVDSPLNGLQIWSILLLQTTPETVIVGACPPRLFRQTAEEWSDLKVPMAQECPRILFNRVTALCADPGNSQSVWAGVEIDGLYRSSDAGGTWSAVGAGLSSRDIHALAVVPGNPTRLIATTNNDVNVSLDEGDTWTPLRLGKSLPLPYFRGLAQQAGNPSVLFLGNGDAPPGTTGLIARSVDGGTTWQLAKMTARANSTIWTFATHLADPNLVYASSVSGQVYRSLDAGASWQKLAREFGEIRALAWTP